MDDFRKAMMERFTGPSFQLLSLSSFEINVIPPTFSSDSFFSQLLNIDLALKIRFCLKVYFGFTFKIPFILSQGLV